MHIPRPILPTNCCGQFCLLSASGLNPAKFAGDWDWMERGIKTWLGTRDLTRVVLEVFDPRNNNLLFRWDFDIVYDYGSNGDGGFG